jgi:hypothetical protein
MACATLSENTFNNPDVLRILIEKYGIRQKSDMGLPISSGENAILGKEMLSQQLPITLK